MDAQGSTNNKRKADQWCTIRKRAVENRGRYQEQRWMALSIHRNLQATVNIVCVHGYQNKFVLFCAQKLTLMELAQTISLKAAGARPPHKMVFNAGWTNLATMPHGDKVHVLHTRTKHSSANVLHLVTEMLESGPGQTSEQMWRSTRGKETKFRICSTAVDACRELWNTTTVT